MQRPFPWFWVLLLGLLVLAPGPAGRLLLDLLGGLTLTLLLLPLLLAGVGVIAWKVLQSRLCTCPACGLSSLGTERCPACGTSLGGATQSGTPASAEAIDPTDVTIDVVAQTVLDPHSEG
ncbi:hypothetical protein [Cyanobium sp. Morenito 9A2]|uniref:hypothetical protein n=1 Tax=Cyanobium sp. Morenito 9A2 TaxID=2823718 RepID=UPI0020CB8238|nr:hypothetical protein [Cyanobium sp. Morenito 9A2]MCP9849884.1 hypothetical protein [Cyanobium sp. Morenito 9A2]